MDHGGVDAVLDVGRAIWHAPEALRVGLVLGEEQFGCAGTGQPVLTEPVVAGAHQAMVACSGWLAPETARALDEVAGRTCPTPTSLRNQRVGSRWSVAGSGPRLVAVMRMKMSSGAALAYSTMMSK